MDNETQTAYINCEYTETTYGYATFAVTEEDLKYYQCNTYEELLAKVQKGDINIFDLEDVDWKSYDSELEEMRPETSTLS